MLERHHYHCSRFIYFIFISIFNFLLISSFSMWTRKLCKKIGFSIFKYWIEAEIRSGVAQKLNSASQNNNLISKKNFNFSQDFVINWHKMQIFPLIFPNVAHRLILVGHCTPDQYGNYCLFLEDKIYKLQGILSAFSVGLPDIHFLQFLINFEISTNQKKVLFSDWLSQISKAKKL